MHVTDYYHLGRTQGEVDFVDVDTATDNPIFIDPRAIRIQQGGFIAESAASSRSFPKFWMPFD
jgi:hypothetical protein